MANEKDTQLKTLGLKSPMEVIDILGALKIDGAPIINDEKVILNQQLKTEAIFKYFAAKFNVKPNELPYIAALIKKKLKNGELRFGA
jgi:hypothetical protein